MARLIPNLIALQAQNNQFQQGMEQSRFQEDQQNNQLNRRLAEERHAGFMEGQRYSNKLLSGQAENQPIQLEQDRKFREGRLTGQGYENQSLKFQSENQPKEYERRFRLMDTNISNAERQGKAQQMELDRAPIIRQREDQTFDLEQKKRSIEIENLGMQNKAGKMAVDQAWFNYEFSNAKRNISAQLARGQSIDTRGMNDAQYMAYRSLIPSPGSTEEVMGYYGSLAKKGYPVSGLFSFDEDMKPIDINVSTPEAVKFWRGYDEAVSSGVKPDAAFDAVAQKLGLDVNLFNGPTPQQKSKTEKEKKVNERISKLRDDYQKGRFVGNIDDEERAIRAEEDRNAKAAHRDFKTYQANR